MSIQASQIVREDVQAAIVLKLGGLLGGLDTEYGTCQGRAVTPKIEPANPCLQVKAPTERVSVKASACP